MGMPEAGAMARLLGGTARVAARPGTTTHSRREPRPARRPPAPVQLLRLRRRRQPQRVVSIPLSSLRPLVEGPTPSQARPLRDRRPVSGPPPPASSSPRHDQRNLTDLQAHPAELRQWVANRPVARSNSANGLHGSRPTVGHMGRNPPLSNSASRSMPSSAAQSTSRRNPRPPSRPPTVTPTAPRTQQSVNADRDADSNERQR